MDNLEFLLERSTQELVIDGDYLLQVANERKDAVRIISACLRPEMRRIVEPSTIIARLLEGHPTAGAFTTIFLELCRSTNTSTPRVASDTHDESISRIMSESQSESDGVMAIKLLLDRFTFEPASFDVRISPAVRRDHEDYRQELFPGLARPWDYNSRGETLLTAAFCNEKEAANMIQLLLERNYVNFEPELGKRSIRHIMGHSQSEQILPILLDMLRSHRMGANLILGQIAANADEDTFDITTFVFDHFDKHVTLHDHLISAALDNNQAALEFIRILLQRRPQELRVFPRKTMPYWDLSKPLFLEVVQLRPELFVRCNEPTCSGCKNDFPLSLERRGFGGYHCTSFTTAWTDFGEPSRFPTAPIPQHSLCPAWWNKQSPLYELENLLCLHDASRFNTVALD